LKTILHKDFAPQHVCFMDTGEKINYWGILLRKNIATVH